MLSVDNKPCRSEGNSHLCYLGLVGNLTCDKGSRNDGDEGSWKERGRAVLILQEPLSVEFVYYRGLDVVVQLHNSSDELGPVHDLNRTLS